MLLANASVDWMSVPQKDRDRATKLCRALRAALQARKAGQPSETVSRLAEDGYRKEFGYSIQPSTVAKLLDGVVRMDAGANEFDRLHLYLPAHCFAPAGDRAPSHGRLAELYEPLAAMLSTVGNSADPTAEDVRLILSAAYRHLALLAEQSSEVPIGSLKSGLIDWLWDRLPGLARSREALRKRFDRGLSRWLKGGCNADALARKARAKPKSHFCEKCIHLIRSAAGEYHGNETTAAREIWKRGMLCPNCASLLHIDLRKNKSYLTKLLRKDVTLNPLVLAFLKSPKDAELMGPHPERDYSDILAGDIFTADDWTTNERVAVSLPGGRWEFFKVQTIVAADVRTGKALDFVMHFGHPYSWSIQRLWLQIYASESIGMPRRGLHLERGAFASALARQGTYENAFDIRFMLDRFSSGCDPEKRFKEDFSNLRVVRGRLATARTIEGDIGRWQKRAAMLPGHLGFNEREENYRLLNDFMARCRVGKDDPRNEGILTIEELRLNYGRILEESNSEPQNGRRCRGASPNELWAEHVVAGPVSRPLERLPDALRYLFSTHKTERWVTPAGIVIPKVDGYEDAVYYGVRRLGELIGQKVTVYYNRLVPDVVTVRVNEQEAFIVKRQKYLSHTATPAQMEDMQRARWNHLDPSRILAGNLAHPMAATVEREYKFPEAQLEMGRQHNVAVDEAVREQSSDSREIAALRRRARALGRPIDSSVDLSKPRIRMGVLMEIESAEGQQKEDLRQ